MFVSVALNRRIGAAQWDRIRKAHAMPCEVAARGSSAQATSDARAWAERLTGKRLADYHGPLRLCSRREAQKQTRPTGWPADRVGDADFGYLPLSLSFVGVELFDMLSLGDADIVPDGAVEEDDDEDDGAMLLELLDALPDGVLVVAEDELEVSLEVVPAGDVVDGAIVLLVELDVGAVPVEVVAVELDDGVVDGVVVVDDVLLVSRWQPAAPSATTTAMATAANGFGFM